MELGSWPTPLEKLETLSGCLGSDVLIKRDDLSGLVYGGNKVRKLEFILADVQRRGKRTIVTMGGIGSHHVLAVAALGRKLNMETVGLFFNQPVTEHVQKNLLLEYHYGTRMCYGRDYPGVAREFIRQYFSIWKREKKAPYFLVPGGSTELSTLGYVNAVLELQTQLKQKGIPDPQAIFTAAGTGGTAAGLLAGTALAGMDTVIRAVRVVPPFLLNSSRITKLARGTLRYLAKRGINTGDVDADLEKRLVLEEDYLGDGYGFATTGANDAINQFKKYENIELEACYTGKAAAALIDYCSNRGKNRSRPVVFFHTCSTTHSQPDASQLECAKEILPAEFHWCFDKR